MADEIPILKDMFDDGEKSKIENFDDWLFTYFKWPYQFVKFRIPDFFRKIKYTFQKIVRPHHCSDSDLWGLDYSLARIILPKLKAFRAQKLNGSPMDFCEWDDDGGLGMTKEEYDKAREEGRFVGGGFEGWLKAIDEMIFAFEYFLYHDGFNKKQKEFFEKYGYKDPHRETDDNLSWGYNYVKSDGSHMSSGELVDLTNEDYKDYKLVGKHKNYIDMPLLKEMGARAQKGFELFGKYFMNLWD